MLLMKIEDVDVDEEDVDEEDVAVDEEDDVNEEDDGGEEDVDVDEEYHVNEEEVDAVTIEDFPKYCPVFTIRRNVRIPVVTSKLRSVMHDYSVFSFLPECQIPKIEN